MAAGDTGNASCKNSRQQRNECALHSSVYTCPRPPMSRLPVAIEDAFQTGALILTANLRAARWLRHEYAQLMRSEGRKAWKTPPIEDWDTWIRRLWQSAGLLDDDVPLLLTELQELQIWLRMQRDDASLLVSPASMAKLAAGAYELLCSYEAHAERNYAWGHTDAEHFQQWAAAFDRECRRQQWLSRGHLEARLAAAIDIKSLPLPSQILLVGFDRVTPAQEEVLGALRRQGILVAASLHEDAPRDIGFVRADDLQDEIEVCAGWVRRLLESSDDEIRVGIVVPDVGAIRGEMARIFRRILMPEADDITASPDAVPFEFSLGQPLSTVPVIRAALLLLQWASAPLREEELSWLLLSGFVTETDTETLAAARLDASLRDACSLSMEIALPSFREKLQRWPQLQRLQSRLLSMEKMTGANRFAEADREPSRWVELLPTLLANAGWPGGRHADAVQFQAMAKWERALEDVALLDFDARLVRFADFLRILESHCEETLFAAESVGAPVQIMGALEAAGQCFDALWFLGVDDGSWPLRGSMHPLLPNHVQQKTKMPHATPQADFELSQAITKSLLASAPVVRISHPARNKDGELRPSPLLALVAGDVQWQSSREFSAMHMISREEHSPAALEEIVDASGEILWPSERSAGGSDVLRDQAACPFRAFASKRLGAQELNRSDWGLTASERGNLLHRVLEAIWSPEFGRLHSLDDLLTAKNGGSLPSLIDDAIAVVFANELGSIEDRDLWLRAYLDSEKRRLSKRLTEWLNLEATRVPFEVIACEEDLNDVSVGGLKLRLRADRIDQLPDFSRLLLDYKTGDVGTADWKVPRPTDPQLPLYAAFGNVEDVCGLLIARIRAGETCMTGRVRDAKRQLFSDISAASSLVKRPYSDIERDEWMNALLVLAQGFLRGDADVDPKDGRATCQYCPLPGLCRIAERPAILDEKEIDAGDTTESGDV